MYACGQNAIIKYQKVEIDIFLLCKQMPHVNGRAHPREQ